MTAQRKYHHGDLKTAYVTAARELLETSGLQGLSLRKCAERIKVSHTSAQNHFGNLAGLLTALVTEGYRELAMIMTADLPTCAPRAQKRDQALLGYVKFARKNPALYELMFARDRIVLDDPALMEEVRACFLILSDISKELGWHYSTPSEQNGKGQIALWSLVHGYAQLLTAGRFKKDNMQGLSILDIIPNIPKEDEQ